MRRTSSKLSSLMSTRKGFGSFHSEDVEVLLRQSNEEYQRPKIYDEIDERLKQSFQSTNTSSGNLKSLFCIDKEWTFINHGAFGGALKSLLNEANWWREYCETQPLRYYDRILLPSIAYNIRQMASYLNCPSSELVPLPNVTTGLNSIINSIPLQLHDEILCFSLTYGSTKKILKARSIQTGATFKMIELLLPLTTIDSVLKQVQSYLNNHTKMIIIDQITSNTALCMPYLEIASMIKSYNSNIIVVIDAAHVLLSQSVNIYPGHSHTPSSFSSLSDINDIMNTSSISTSATNLLLNTSSNSKNNNKSINTNSNINNNVSIESQQLTSISISQVCDIWITNGHKWLSTTKGCAYMWIHPKLHGHIRPAILSHGYIPDILPADFTHTTDTSTTNNSTYMSSEGETAYAHRNKLASSYIWDGCRDYSAILTTHSALILWTHYIPSLLMSFPSFSMSENASITSENSSLISSRLSFSSAEVLGVVETNTSIDHSSVLNPIEFNPPVYHFNNTQQYNDNVIRQYNQQLLHQIKELLEKEWNVSCETAVASSIFTLHSPMTLIPLPNLLGGKMDTTQNMTDNEAFMIQELLHHQYRVEVPIKCIQGQLFIRISVHIYNTIQEYEYLAQVIKSLQL